MHSTKRRLSFAGIIARRPQGRALQPFLVRILPRDYFLVLLVNDSEYNQSTGAKPILSPSCIYLVSLGALLLLLWHLRIFAAAAAAARPHPTPPPFFGGGKCQKKKIACSVGDGVWTFWCRRGRGQSRGALGEIWV